MTSSCDIFLVDVSRKRIWNVVHDVVPSSKHHVRAILRFQKGLTNQVQVYNQPQKCQNRKVTNYPSFWRFIICLLEEEEAKNHYWRTNTTFSLKVCFLLRSSFLDRIEDGMRHERGPCVSNGKGIHDWEDIVLIDKSEMGLSTDNFIRKYCFKINSEDCKNLTTNFWVVKNSLLASFFDT